MWKGMKHHFQYLIAEINSFKLMIFNVYNYKIKETNKYLNILNIATSRH